MISVAYNTLWYHVTNKQIVLPQVEYAHKAVVIEFCRWLSYTEGSFQKERIWR